MRKPSLEHFHSIRNQFDNYFRVFHISEGRWGHVYLPALIPHVLHRHVEGDGQEYHEHTEDRHWIHVETSVCWEQMTEILKNDKKHMFYLS